MAEQAFVAPPIASAGGRVIASPFQFYTTGEDNLRIVSVNAYVGVRLKIQGRFIDAKGVISASSWDHTPNTDRTKKTDDVPLGVGAVLNLTVFASQGTPLIGQTFVIVQLVRGLGAAAIVLGTLLQGYVTSAQALGWPGSPIVSSTDGEPAVRTIAGTNPAIGVDIIETVPTNARWELLSVQATLNRSAVGAAGEVVLVLDQTVISFGVIVSHITAGPGTSNTITFGIGLVTFSAPFGTGLLINGSLPENRLLAGEDFRIVRLNPDPADTWSGVGYKVREWQEVF